MKRWDLVLLVVVWLVAVLFVASGQFPDPDLWGRLSVAALLFQGGQFPYHDVFSFTAPGAPWVDHEWLTGVVFYQILIHLGEPGFLLFKYGMMLAIFALLFRLHRRTYHTSPLYAFYALLILLPIYAIGLYATLRSQIFSFFLFTLFLYLLETDQEARSGTEKQKPDIESNRRHSFSHRLKALWPMLPLGILWGNLHGGFIVGVLLTGAYGVISALRERRLQAALPYGLLAAAIFLGVGLINPYGPRYLQFLIHAWTLDRSGIAEWNDINPGTMLFWPAQLLIAVTAITLLARWLKLQRRPDAKTAQSLIAPGVVLGWLIVMTLLGIRFQPFLALAVTAYLPLILRSRTSETSHGPQMHATTIERPPAGRSGIENNELAKSNGTLEVLSKLQRFFHQQNKAFSRTLPLLLGLSAAGGLVYLQVYTGLFHVPLQDELFNGAAYIRYPLGALRYLENSPYRGNLMIRFGLGEFAYWRLYPRFKVSMDGRYEEVYNQAQFRQNHRFYDKQNLLHAADTLKTADHLKVDFIITEPDIPHTPIFMRDPRWKHLYSDDYYVLFGRRSTLEKFPAYEPHHMLVTSEWVTIEDMVTHQDLLRFRK